MKVFITRPIPDQGIKMLKAKGYQISIYPKDEVIPRQELLKRVKGANALLSILTDKIDDEVLTAAGSQPRRSTGSGSRPQASGLKIVANYAVGFDNIDLPAAQKHGIMVTNTPCSEIVESVAEHAIALIFGLARRIVEVDAFTRAGKYKAWGPQLLLGTDIVGKTLGIIGTGRIGTALARRMYDGFEIKIIYTDVKRNPELEKKFGAKFRSKDQLLKEADFISLHVPMLPSTRHLISTKELKLMKKTAFLINTSRGPIVDELALVKALTKKEIGGAGLDVYECEPLIDCNPNDTYELRKLSNVILTPHTASATVETRQAMSRTAAKNIIAVLSGKKPPNLVG